MLVLPVLELLFCLIRHAKLPQQVQTVNGSLDHMQDASSSLTAESNSSSMNLKHAGGQFKHTTCLRQTY